MNDGHTVNSSSILEAIKTSLTIRLIVIGVLILIFLIPLAMIESLIHERQGRRNRVVEEINSVWAERQTLVGPMLKIPYRPVRRRTERPSGTERRDGSAYFLPDRLVITGTIVPEVRYRGIYKSIVYTADLEISGEFTPPDFAKLKIPESEIAWNNAVLVFGIDDMRGVNRSIQLEWNGNQTTPVPGKLGIVNFSHGVNADASIDPTRKTNYTFAMRLSLRGSEALHFLPVGRKTEVRIDSGWSSPGFGGAFLPKHREIDTEGFNAQWEIFDYNREFPQQWSGGNVNMLNSRFGVRLVDPVDEYQKTFRSVKYAVLFISLTFLAFFLLIELFGKKRLHPIQYLLVGFALCIFYLLLISLSEHMTFDYAYLISSLAVVALTVIYSKSMAGRRYMTVLMGMIFTGLYSFLYVMLRLEDYSLLMGSLGLFLILTAVMMGTRKIDWYSRFSSR